MRKLLISFFAALLAFTPFVAYAGPASVNVGSAANDGTGDALRTAFQKVNGNIPYFTSHPGYVVGNWYAPSPWATVAGSAAIGNGNVKFIPVIFKDKMTIDQIAVRISTGAAGNVQVALYASDTTTKKPTGNALVTTGSGSTASVATVSISLASNYQVSPGVLYWFGVMCDNATAQFNTISLSSAYMSWLYGSTTNTNVLTGSANIEYLSAPFTTFGTWPDMTSATFTDGISASSANVAFHVTSIP